LVGMFATLANPHRMRILAALARGGRNYVSQLARELGISRPLLHVHLARLEAAGLVVGSLELSAEGKALKYFDVVPFGFHLSPETIALAERSLSEEAFEADRRGKHPRGRREAGPEGQR
jgi:DNA-binding transcriptional ArsR family regulator